MLRIFNATIKITAFLFFISPLIGIAQSNTALTLNSSAAAFNAEGKYDDALANINEAIQQNPGLAYLYITRARTYNLKKDRIRAIADFTEALRLEPQNLTALTGRGYAYFNEKLYDKSIGDNDKALQLDPKNLMALSNRAASYNNSGDKIKALEDLNTLVMLDAKNPVQWAKRGAVYVNIGEYQKAISDLSTALELNPKDISSLNNRGWAFARTGQYKRSVTDYKILISIQPQESRAYISMMPSLIRMGQFSEARAVYKDYQAKGLSSYITNDDWKFFIHYLRAATEHIPAGQYQEALRSLDQSLKEYGSEIKTANKSGYADVLALKGYLLEKLNRDGEALDAYNQATVINPDQPDVSEAVKRLVQKQGIAKQKDNTQPIIELISPRSARGLQIVKNESKIEIVGRAKDESGIKSIAVNGLQVDKVEEDGLFLTTIVLKEGQNSITVIATDKNDNAGTKTFQLNAILPSVAKTKEEPAIIPVDVNKPPVFHAILIASNEYQDPAIDDLQNPSRDAESLKQILQNNYTFNANNIQTVYNKTREEIMQAIIQKSNSLGENDNLLIFYAGHGIAEKDKFGDVDGYWVPVSAKKGMNSTYISSDDINKALKRSNSKHILVIADACFSGAFTRSISNDAPKEIQVQYTYPSRKIMASGNMEPVPDNSKFIYYLNKNLKENRVKYLTAKDLFNSFYKAIINNTETFPQYAAIKGVGDEGGEFVFIMR
ncbi:tetratricopeptide repeat protein [Pedobacter ginsengisoli]|uniref:tetratricopeptide repeat protein n=1 Tax=Pedobacter ginsengisoli TaxID=363852 RepID=UPI0025500B03|nr:tetratricopeptide repeat protein [Pedobacter ginsengisoli]